jgi:signal transduction histidine kinase
LAESIAELKALTKEELIFRHDRHSNHTIVGTGHYLDELRSRENAELSASVEKVTKYIFWLTCIMAVATLLQLGLVLWDFLGT